jgi:hypothetical protein
MVHDLSLAAGRSFPLATVDATDGWKDVLAASERSHVAASTMKTGHILLLLSLWRTRRKRMDS